MLPAKVNVVEVGARDGLQNEATVTLENDLSMSIKPNMSMKLSGKSEQCKC